jgi:hypothetical protein
MTSTDKRTYRQGRSRPDLSAEQGSVFEFKERSQKTPMPLQQFHRSVIEVELETGGSHLFFKGEARYDRDPNYGPVLWILIKDQLGNLELMLTEAEWKGKFHPSRLPDCDYRILLSSRESCSS